MAKYLIASLLILTAACSKDDDNDKDASLALNGQTYVVVDGSPTSTTSEIKGSGTVAFTAPVADDGKDFAVSANLEDGGSLLLTTFADAKLQGGVGIRFTRSGTTLKVALVGSTGEVDASAAFASVDASQALSYFIDVHNDEEPAHVVIWSQAATLGTPLLNSEEGFETPGNGTGRIWGLTLDEATVTAAEAIDAKFED